MKRRNLLLAASLVLLTYMTSGKILAQSDRHSATPRVLQEMAAAYHNSKTLRFDVTLYKDGALTRTSRFYYARPTATRVETQAGSSKLIAIGNYDNLTLITSDGKEQQLKSAPGLAMLQVLKHTETSIYPWSMIESGSDIFASTAAMRESKAKIVEKPDAVVSGVPTATIALIFGQGREQTTCTYSIGKQDHLLRRIIIESRKDGRTHLQREDYTNVAANVELPTETFLSPSVIAWSKSLRPNKPH